ncbi:MAG: PTS sugar transporter subunit IIA [Spirochaetota bacterium]
MKGIVSLADLVARGGVGYALKGSNPREVIEAASSLVALPESIDREGLCRALLEREGLLSTAIGRGLALPHPRNNLHFTAETQRVALFFTAEPIDFAALDGQRVFALFIVLSADPRSHLGVLAELAHLSRREDFHALLSRRPAEAELVSWLRNYESGWNQGGLKPDPTR